MNKERREKRNSEIGDRLRSELFKIFKNVTEASAALGMSTQSLSQYLNGKRIPGNKVEARLELIGVDMDYINTGRATDANDHQKISQEFRIASRAKNLNGVRFFTIEGGEKEIWIPLWNSPISNGQPAIIYDDRITLINATKHLHSDSFYVEAKGRSMEGAGIREGAILLVDKRVEAVNGKIVLAVVDGEYTVKRLKTNGKWWLLHPDPEPENNKEFPVIEFDDSVEIVGVIVECKYSL